MHRRLLLALVILVMLAAPARRRSVTPPVGLNLDMRRSFIVTDKAILEGFSFDRVLQALIDRSGVRGLTTARLYRQWLDTQNPKPGLADASGPHCDDFSTDGAPAFNGFPRRCPTPEGSLAAQPYAPGEIIPLAVVNRFDLTPPDGSNCGQYRMIFARIGKPNERLHFIFESVLPNPHPEAGLAGCRPVADFWSSLSRMDSAFDRRTKLESFFFDGISGFPPVIHPDHYSVTGGGIRTMESAPSASPRFYQFRSTKQCDGGDCMLRMTPDTLENQPFGRLFDASIDTPKGRAFREAFVGQVANLAIRDVNLYFMNIPRDFLMAESNPSDSEPAFIYDGPFIRGARSAEGQQFRARVQAELTRIGSTLLPEQIVNRAETQSCVGCHVLSGPVGENVIFPRSIDGLQQVTEDRLENGEGGPNSHYQISPAMAEVFIPHRMKILADFLTTGKAPEHSQTIGGGRSVQ
ncbi:MAG TPA: hypothetical protein VER58_21850 [Thermoanaerobaculia bacterium]|nr:hypothetical protein [Thermoanaerobaculia bacterium]